jgi:hypothetical protein
VRFNSVQCVKSDAAKRNYEGRAHESERAGEERTASLNLGGERWPIRTRGGDGVAENSIRNKRVVALDASDAEKPLEPPAGLVTRQGHARDAGAAPADGLGDKRDAGVGRSIA